MKEDDVELICFERPDGRRIHRLVHTPTGEFVDSVAGYQITSLYMSRLLNELKLTVKEKCSLNPHWLTPTVQQLAAVIYEERQFDKMPVMGDALKEAGCDNGDVLQHCRSGGEHVRGCWVVDKVLGKE